MERRFSRRIPIELTTILYSNGLPIAKARTGDLGLLGTFVHMCPDLLRKHRVVEIEFFRNGRSVDNTHRLPAMVVRHTEDGVGVIFETSDPKTRRTVQALLRDQQPSRAATAV